MCQWDAGSPPRRRDWRASFITSRADLVDVGERAPQFGSPHTARTAARSSCAAGGRDAAFMPVALRALKGIAARIVGAMRIVHEPMQPAERTIVVRRPEREVVGVAERIEPSRRCAPAIP